MADVTISGWDKNSGKNHAGVIKLLRDYCDLTFDQAHSLSLKLINDNATRRVSVPFMRRETFIRELQSRGFRTS